MLDELRASRDGYGIHWMKFLKLLAANQGKCVCVFEGDDSKYYGCRLDDFCVVDWIPLKAGGRGNVLKIFSLARSAKPYYERSYFFIDRDFDDPSALIDDHRLYITPGYSIENLYCGDSVIMKILRDEFSCPSGGAEDDEVNNQLCHESILKDFRASRSSFLDQVLLINSWIVCHRRKESASPGSGRLNLGNFNIANYVTVDLTKCSAVYDIDGLHQKFSNAEVPTAEELRDACDFLHSRGLESTCRGKFLAYFMRTYIGRLKDDACTQAPRLVTNRAKPKLNLSDKNFLSELAQYADTPPCFRSFMASMKS